MDFEHIPSGIWTWNNTTGQNQHDIRIILGNDFIDQVNANTHRLMD
jgi:hypothetical protein